MTRAATMTRTCGADIGQRGAWAHALVALVALGLAACTVKVGPREPEAREIASLGVAGGEVFVNGERARNGQAIREGDEVSTGPASSAWIQLHDGGYFQLDEETDPIYLFKRIGTAWCLLMRMVRGQAYADRKAACVETPNGSGEAASAFNVSVSPDGGSTEIAVFEGHVTFTSEGQRREIVAGELGRFRRDAPPEVGRALLPEAQLKLVRWRERYHFDAWCCLPSGEVEAVQPALCQERGELFFDRLDALRRCSSAAPTPSPSPGPSPTPGAVEVAFSAAPEAIDRGEEARLCYAVDRRSRARIEPGVGAVEASERACVTVRPQRTTTYRLVVETGGKETAVREATVHVRAPTPVEPVEPAPGTTRPTTPGTVTPGTTTRPGTATPGTATRPGTTTPGTASPGTPTQPGTEVKPGGEVQPGSRSWLPSMRPVMPALVAEITVEPQRIRRGASARLCYKIDERSRARIEPTIGAIKASGCSTVRPLETTVYRLEVQRGEDAARREVTLEVEAPPSLARPPTQTPTPGQPSQPTPSVTFRHLRESNLPGRDYRHFRAPEGIKACEAACAGEDRCRAYTFVAPGPREKVGVCWLKSAAAKPVAEARCTSGIKEP